MSLHDRLTPGSIVELSEEGGLRRGSVLVVRPADRETDQDRDDHQTARHATEEDPK